ncbi:hypothetical protein EYM_05195 [Ignicoccus islandicus DSM 13165]|uniref:FAD/NAD(P)-binding domain-containing protein n=1 Tax=Ignicoccus islandicus DSM 13165 TaxID=940295 RepID=A0A0U2U921_9CREN|nr:FAD-dependent oxidoreductase [Ignicoccus islandicus]ALU12564.1 hypothetical protein EYM_05195 [Ignicoccus islandicus DSM 13165]
MRVIVVGNGFGALSASRAAEVNGLEVIQIGPRKFEYLPSLTKILSGRKRAEDLTVEPNFRWEFVEDLVTEVEETENGVKVVTENGREYEGDFAVLAPGSEPWVPVEGVYPLYRINHAVEVKRKLDELGNDATIAVVGTGLVGLETLGELRWMNASGKASYRLKAIEAAPVISPTLPCEKIKPVIMNKLRKYGIEVHLNSLVSEVKNGKVITSSGNEIEADLVIWAAGVKGPKVKVNCAERAKRDFFVVDEFQRAKGCKRTYVAGDAANSKALKMAEEAMRQGWYAVLHAIGKKRDPYVPFLTSERPFCFITLGPTDGISVLNKVVIPGRLAPIAKEILEKWMLRMAKAAKMKPPVPV